MLKFICGVPENECKGTLSGTSAAISERGRQKARKLHTTSEEACYCHRQYLVGLGYKQLSRRTMETPEGSVLVLNRRYPAMRPGKEGRHMPRQGKGVII